MKSDYGLKDMIEGVDIINEMQLISEKRSKLSRMKRDEVCKRYILKSQQIVLDGEGNPLGRFLIPGNTYSVLRQAGEEVQASPLGEFIEKTKSGLNVFKPKTGYSKSKYKALCGGTYRDETTVKVAKKAYRNLCISCDQSFAVCKANPVFGKVDNVIECDGWVRTVGKKERDVPTGELEVKGSSNYEES